MEEAMLLLTLRKLSSVLFCLLFANSVWADSVLIIHQGYSSVHSNVGGRLTNEGHTVTYSTSEVSDLSSYDQVWDVRYQSLSSTATSNYNTFVQNGGFLYLVTENPTCCGTRNTAVANMISAMGGGSGLTIGGMAGSTSNTITQVNTTYMTSLNGSSIAFAASSAITNYGNGQWLLKDASGKVAGVMWAGGAGDLDSDYTGTVITIADVNWLDATRFSGTNITALDDIIAGIVAGTVQGTISESGNTGGGAATPIYSSGITAAQSSRRSAALTGILGHEAHINIEGNSNEVNITQAGDTHYLELGIIGSSNTVDIEQVTVSTGTHYLETTLTGSNNNLDILQSGSSKTAFVNIDGDYNTASVIQRDLGNHYLQLDLIGDNHNATILQEGSGNHAATVELTNGGGPWTFDLTQSGNTGKEYNLPHSMSDGSTTSGTCYVAAGCSLTVIQSD